jgi:hypothetical protein
MDLAKLKKWFFNFNFFGGGGGAFVTKTSLLFFKSAENFQFFDTLYHLFQGKKISPLRRTVFQYFLHKIRK